LFAGILLLNACASTAPKPKSGDTFMLPDIPTAAAESSAIPYPDLNTMTQIERLGMQAERLEREMENTNQRLQQLEK
ncbi:tetratricopeptide repeat protein, partial [Neisseria sp. P0009.S007]